MGGFCSLEFGVLRNVFYNSDERGISPEDENIDEEYGLFASWHMQESINLYTTRAYYLYFPSVEFVCIVGNIQV